jgi:arylsulfate sulfotransferase
MAKYCAMVCMIVALCPFIRPQAANAQMSVSLTASIGSGQPVGTVPVWSASVINAASSIAFRFSVQPIGGRLQIVQDFSLNNTFQWTALQEGLYLILVAAADTNGASATAAFPFQFTSRVVANTPVVSPTTHPLVALYSAPACSTGTVSVFFRPAAGGTWQNTSSQSCQGKSVNFYVAGMRQNTPYVMIQQLNDGTNITTGPALNFQTGTPTIPLPAFNIVRRGTVSTNVGQGILLTSFVATLASFQPAVLATDLTGNLVWYDPFMSTPAAAHSYMVRPIAGGTMLSLIATGNSIGQRLRETDLVGNLVRETNVARISQQLVAAGKPRISWLSHEAFRLPNGHTLVFGSVEKLLYNIQGPGLVDVVGDMILDLDENFQVANWTWNSFDWLNTSRIGTLNDTCAQVIGCGPLYLASTANDWTHANSIFYNPDDGNLIVSVRHQDWLIKIDYRNGGGTGQILWKLGQGGDFTTNSADPWPWFSHQHQAELHNGILTVYDNGNTRVARTGSGNSRGQVYLLDELSKTAALSVNKDLGVYSSALGSADLLSNGNYHFLSGCVGCANASGTYTNQAVEVLPSGASDYSINWQGQAYRSFRLTSLYSYIP